MISATGLGLLTGFLLCSTFGTVFFSLIQTSIDNGFRDALKLILGVIVCDLLFVFFAIFGTSSLPDIPHFDKWLAGGGMLFLLGMGIANFTRQQPQLAYPKTRIGNFIYFFSTGFLLNGLNPVNFISWVSLATYVRGTLHYDFHQVLAFFGASLVGIFVTESVFAFFADKFQRIFTPSRIVLLNRITGVVFIAIALQIGYTTFLK